MGPLPQPIPILNLSSSSCTLLRSNIDGVLAQVGRRPVFPISINGKIRSGKSSLMNKVIRDLEARRGNRNLDPSYGFSSRGGRLRETVGINLWPIPYFITIAGEEVAVLLLDTQGLYDGHTSPRQNVLIPAINSLLSSVMLFNYMSQVDFEDLRRIREFSEIASSLPVVLQDAFTNPAWNGDSAVPSGNGSHSKKLYLDKFGLNQLIVIERNSPSSGQFKFGIHDATQVPKGSPQNCFRATFMLDNTNALDESSDRALEIRHGILCNVKDVKMCLLPHPGLAFVDPREGQGVEPSAEFNDTVQLLIETMLSSANFQKYKFSVHDLRDRLRIIDHVCDHVDEYLTDVASEEEMTRDLRYSYALTQSVNYYGQQMVEYQLKNESASKEQRERAHTFNLNAAMEMFKRLRRRQVADLEKKFTPQLEQQIEAMFEFLEEQQRKVQNKKILRYVLYGVAALVAAGALVWVSWPVITAIPWSAIGKFLIELISANSGALIGIGGSTLASILGMEANTALKHKNFVM